MYPRAPPHASAGAPPTSCAAIHRSVMKTQQTTFQQTRSVSVSVYKDTGLFWTLGFRWGTSQVLVWSPADVSGVTDWLSSHCVSADTCEGVKCSPGKVCKMKMERPQCVCSPDCSHLSKKHAVCGSDGNSYKDECALLMARCMGHPDLEVMYQGECKSRTPPVDSVLDEPAHVFILQRSVFSRVLLQRCVSRNAHMRDRPDQQRSLRHVSHHAMPHTQPVWAAHLRQWQHHLPQRLPPPQSHLLPGPLHRGPPLRPLQQ